MKGNPQHMNRGLDCDVIVAEVGCDTINVFYCVVLCINPIIYFCSHPL